MRGVLPGDRCARMRRSSVTSAAAVSSQLHSMPRIEPHPGFPATAVAASSKPRWTAPFGSAPAARRWRWRRPQGRRRLCAAHGWGEEAIEIVPITHQRRQDPGPAARRDRRQGAVDPGARPLAGRGRIDVAVHSMKDVETIRPDILAHRRDAAARRHARRAVGAASLAALPNGARVGTSSPRRAAQLLARRPICHRRLPRQRRDAAGQARRGEADATLLAAPVSTGSGSRDRHAPAHRCLLPAPAQGAIGVEGRAARDRASAGRRDRPCADPCLRWRRAAVARGARRRLPLGGGGTRGWRHRGDLASRRDPDRGR